MTATSFSTASRHERRTSRIPNCTVIGPLAAAVVGLGFGACSARAQFSYTETFNNVNLTVPDGSTLGVSDTRPISSGLIGTVREVRVSIELTGSYTGDLYVALLHEGVAAVLMNRVGRRAGDDLGYADSGLNVTFSDTAPSGDVHVYRQTLSGNHNTPLGGPLTGTWQPDARLGDPYAVLDTSGRSAYLSKFAGFSPDGQWTLYLADLSPVGESMLKSWSLEVVVPEPAAVTGVVAFGLLGWTCWRKRSGNARPPKPRPVRSEG